MANRMQEVANILGVELGERFNIRTPDGLDAENYYFDKDGLKQTGSGNWLCGFVILHLLNGQYSIEPIPWKPSFNERYYSIGPGGVLEPGNWANDFIDRALYKLGNCYRTAQEAEVNRDKWVAFYESDRQLEV